jgi:hypothetical protein
MIMALIISKEHIELMFNFEKNFPHLRLDKEDKSMWAKKRIYQNGAVNDLFLAYRLGYALGKAVADERLMSETRWMRYIDGWTDM